MDNWEYMGWVPCLNGHLDFGLMKVGISGPFSVGKSQDREYISVNQSTKKERDSHERKIFLQSKVDWRDSETFNPEDGLFRVLVTAEVTPSHSMDMRALSGHISIYPIAAEPSSYAERMDMNIHRLSHELRDIATERDRINLRLGQNENNRFDVLTNDINDCFSKLEKIVSSETAIEKLDDSYFFSSFEFRIEANGIVWIKSVKDNIRKDIRYIIARQAYYFLKYSLHIHKHHQTKQDALTTIVALSDDNNDGRSEAGLRLVCQLKRELTSLNRIKSNRAHRYKDQFFLNDTCGIIAYGKALIRSLRNGQIFSEEIADRELERFDDLKSSSDALNFKMDKMHGITELVSAKSKVLVGLCMGLFYFILGRQFVINNSAIDITGAVNNIPKLLTASSVFCIAFLMSYFIFKKIYSSKHGLEDPDRAEAIFNTHKNKFYIRIGCLCFAWAAMMYINYLFGDTLLSTLSKGFSWIGDAFSG
ncbi:hypothetical protein [Cellvibrio sp. OA-2007]|uniref:hypothetical protein n=1 Tax=Cellvibrio sp. OA-2007 TaxID=529823 RepID=UPI0007849F72|nr:hypothetical protein [Cellvibrio sp. OA-2007]